MRTPKIKSLTIPGGEDVLWLPSNNKTFALKSFIIQITSDAAQTTGGTVTISLKDNGYETGLSFSFYVSATPATTNGNGQSTGWVTLDEPYLGSKVGKELTVYCSSTFTDGSIRVTACGYEF